MTTQEKNLIKLLAAAIGENNIVLESPDYNTIINLAQKHGVSNMLGHALNKVLMDQQPETTQKNDLKKTAYIAAVRETLLESELVKLSDVFRRKRIIGVPLKGSVLKRLYPSSDLRHMSDVDILIDHTQSEQVRDCMVSEGWLCLRYGEGDTDLYISNNLVKYEIHKDLSEESFNSESQSFCSNLFLRAINVDYGFCELPVEEHYAYILCHFVKHLLYGGIGVRQVMDVYVCRENWKFNEEKLDLLLEKLELKSFAETLERLAYSWFGGEKGDEISDELGRYILDSGVFGTEEHRVADRMLKEQNGKNKLSYAFTRLFPDYKTMCFYYPVLKKWAVLLPVFWVWRMIYATLYRREKLRNEISAVNETDGDALKQRAAFYQRCGLNVYTK